jgi:hypothetical protein
MSNHNSPYARDFLVPERTGGGSSRAYQLTADSVSPTRITGRDKAGRPIEETIPVAYHKRFVMLDGGINRVPLRTAAVFSMEPQHERYEHITTRELLRAGCMPLEVCPYTQQHFAVTGTRHLVDNPDKIEDCGGHAEGCSHMQEVIKLRREQARAEWEESQKSMQSMKSDDVERLMQTTAKAFGVALSQNQTDQKAARRNLRDGKGEE